MAIPKLSINNSKGHGLTRSLQYAYFCFVEGVLWLGATLQKITSWRKRGFSSSLTCWRWVVKQFRFIEKLYGNEILEPLTLVGTYDVIGCHLDVHGN